MGQEGSRQTVEGDKTLDEVSVNDYDAIVLPSGQINPDLLQVEPKALKFIKDSFDAQKIVAAVFGRAVHVRGSDDAARLQSLRRLPGLGAPYYGAAGARLRLDPQRRHHGPRSSYGAAHRWRREPVGTLWLEANQGHFNNEHSRVMAELAAFAAVALRIIQTEQRLNLAM